MEELKEQTPKIKWNSRAVKMAALATKAKEQQLFIMQDAYQKAEIFATFCNNAVTRVGGEPEVVLQLSKKGVNMPNEVAHELLNKAITTDKNFLEMLWGVALEGVEEAKKVQADLLAQNLRDMYRDFG